MDGAVPACYYVLVSVIIKAFSESVMAKAIPEYIRGFKQPLVYRGFQEKFIAMGSSLPGDRGRVGRGLIGSLSSMDIRWCNSPSTCNRNRPFLTSQQQKKGLPSAKTRYVGVFQCYISKIKKSCSRKRGNSLSLPLFRYWKWHQRFHCPIQNLTGDLGLFWSWIILFHQYSADSSKYGFLSSSLYTM